jgi:hypothetical protein
MLTRCGSLRGLLPRYPCRARFKGQNQPRLLSTGPERNSWFSFEVLAMVGVAGAGVGTLAMAAYETPMEMCRASDATYRPYCQNLALGADVAR